MSGQAPRLPVPPPPQDPPQTPRSGHPLPDGTLPTLPHRTAQEALRRLVRGDEAGTGGDPRARDSVFTDLSGPSGPAASNGRPGDE